MRGPLHSGMVHEELQRAQQLLAAGRAVEAEPVLRGLLAREPGSAPAMVMLAGVLEIRGKLDELIGLMRRALEIEPGSAPALGVLARALRTQGKYEVALATLEPLAAGVPTVDRALALAPIYNALKRHGEARGLVGPLAGDPSLAQPARAALAFNLGDALHGLGEFDAAFAAYKRANDSYPKTFSRPRQLALYRDLRAAFTAERVRGGERAGVDGSRCVFVVGMPRSGTTLVEQIIDAHPRALGAGELPDLRFVAADLDKALGGRGPAGFAGLTGELLERGARAYLGRLEEIAREAGADAARVVDKLPHNFELVGLINRMLPGARVIHCVRDPVDTCLSCYFTALGPAHSYSNSLADLAWAYGQYRRLMADWAERCDVPMLEVRYEDVVADVGTHARRIVDFVGLGWDERCLRFHESERAVSTASVDQVRRPIYRSSVARWKRYEKHLGALLESLKAAGVGGGEWVRG